MLQPAVDETIPLFPGLQAADKGEMGLALLRSLLHVRVLHVDLIPLRVTPNTIKIV